MVAKKENLKNLELRDNVWYFRKTFKGKSYHKRLCSNKNKAKKMRDDCLYELRHFGELKCEVLDSRLATTGEMSPLFGEVALLWSKMREADIRQKQLKESSMRDYRSIMNGHILPHFGNIVISDITAADVDDFVHTLTCSAKRINNILVPLRSLFKMAKKRQIVSENIMLDVDNLKAGQSDIFPLDKAEIGVFLNSLHVHYQPFFQVAFCTGMRFGEMAALKWKNVDFTNDQIHIKETLVYGEEGPPKTIKSKRTIDMFSLVKEALLKQRKMTGGKGKYVFRDLKGRLMVPDHVREHVWKPALIKAELEYRPMLQTRHTFATIAIDAGEDLGWVQQMLGHSSLQMIFTTYYGWMKKSTRNDGSAFVASMKKSESTEAVPGNENA